MGLKRTDRGAMSYELGQCHRRSRRSGRASGQSVDVETDIAKHDTEMNIRYQQ